MYGLSALEERNLWRQASLCTAVHLIACPHQFLGHLYVTWLSLLSSLDAMMMPQSQQPCISDMLTGLYKL